MELWGLQLCFAGIISLATGLASLLPLWSVLWARATLDKVDDDLGQITNDGSDDGIEPARKDPLFQSKGISWANNLAGGVFLGMSLMGLLPASQEKWVEASKASHNHTMNMDAMARDKNIGNVIMVLGFTSLFVLQHLLVNLWREESLAPSNEASEQSRLTHHCGSRLSEATESFESIKVILLLVGITGHNFLEGLSLGLQTDGAVATTLFIGILSHGILLSFAVTTTALSVWIPSGVPAARIHSYLLALVIIRPCGILLGIFVASNKSVAFLYASATLQSLSAGVLIHVVFMSVLPSEYPFIPIPIKKLTLKLGLFTLGWMLFAAMNFALKHSH